MTDISLFIAQKPNNLMENVTGKFLPIDSIILLDENPRSITKSQLNKLAKDIKEDPNFLYQRPPLINLKNGDYLCYAGTQRIKAAQINNQTEIYCLIEENVSKKVQNKRMVIDNLHRGKWDEDKLLQLDFELLELKDFGFKDFEISLFNDFKEEEPTDLIAPKKDAPPTLKLTFESEKQMEYFEAKLKTILIEDEKLYSVTYSVSQGEI